MAVTGSPSQARRYSSAYLKGSAVRNQKITQWRGAGAQDGPRRSRRRRRQNSCLEAVLLLLHANASVATLVFSHH